MWRSERAARSVLLLLIRLLHEVVVGHVGGRWGFFPDKRVLGPNGVGSNMSCGEHHRVARSDSSSRWPRRGNRASDVRVTLQVCDMMDGCCLSAVWRPKPTRLKVGIEAPWRWPTELPPNQPGTQNVNKVPCLRLRGRVETAMARGGMVGGGWLWLRQQSAPLNDRSDRSDGLGQPLSHLSNSK